MDHLKTTIDSVRNLKWDYFNEQFFPAVSEHKSVNDSQFSNLLQQLWGTERVLCYISSSSLEALWPLLQELDCVLGRAITLVKEVCFKSEDPTSRQEHDYGEHCLEVFLDLRWWTWVLIYNAPLRTVSDRERFLVTPKGVLDPSSSRLPSFMQKLHLWWRSSDARRLPSYGIEVSSQETEGLSSLVALLKVESGEQLDKFVLQSADKRFIIEGKVLVPVRCAEKPSWMGDELKVDLTQVFLGMSSSGLVIKCEYSGKEYALKRLQNLDQWQPLIARLCHPHIVQLMSYWRENGFLFLMMELMEGDLKDLLKRRLRDEKSPFMMNVVLDILLQIAKAMLYLHDMGLTHPDLKSSDVLYKEAADRPKLDKYDTKYLVKLSDSQFSSQKNFDSMVQQNVYQFGLICLEALSMESLHWEVEDRVMRMPMERPEQFDKIQKRLGYAIPGSLAQCIAWCFDGKIKFSEVVVMLLLAQVQEPRRAAKETSPRSSESETTLLVNQQGRSGPKLLPKVVNLPHRVKVCDAVYVFHKPEGQVDVEIVFIHGLGFYESKEAYWKTWLTMDETQENCWPETWLVEKFPHARILSLSYDATLQPTMTSGRIDLFFLGERLVAEMTFFGRIGQHECPVVFVCHGFGSLVAKQIVVTASNSQQEKVQNFLRNLQALYFHGASQVELQDNPSLQRQVGRLDLQFEQIKREVGIMELICFNVGEVHAPTHGSLDIQESSTGQVGYVFSTSDVGHFDNWRLESKEDPSYLSLVDHISKVVKMIREKRNYLVELPSGLVERDDIEKSICEKLQKASIIGLVGMGGVGKTTVTKVVYNSQAKFYDKACFLQDVGSKDLALVQKELLYTLCGAMVGNTDHVSPNDIRSIKQCIMAQRVLIVIDGVKDSNTLVALQVPTFQRSLSNGSRVIVTCRSRQVLIDLITQEELEDVEFLYMDFLDEDQALKLFRYHAFHGIEDEDDEDFKDLAQHIVKACNGLPLCLEVTGLYLRKQHVDLLGKRKEIWEEALEKLLEVKSFDGDANEVLWTRQKIDYDDVDNETKSKFLDFVCFFCGKSLDSMEQSIRWMWRTPTELLFLLARSPINVGGSDNRGWTFWIYNQLRAMGEKILEDLSSKETPLKGPHVSLEDVTHFWKKYVTKSFFVEYEVFIL